MLQTDRMTYLKVAVAAPLNHTLTYSLPEELVSAARPGVRVLAPLGGRLVTGYLLGTIADPPADYRTRPIADILDTAPLFPENMVPLYRWIAGYYHYPIGEVIKAALPGGLISQSGRRIQLTESGEKGLAEVSADTISACAWLPRLLDKKELTPAAARKIWRTKDRRLLENWDEKGWVRIEQEVSAATSKTKTETCVRLAGQAAGPITGIKLKPSEDKTLQLLAEMTQSPTGSLPRKEVVKRYKGAARALKSLAEKELVLLEETAVYRDPFGEQPPYFPKPAQLTEEQTAALEEIIPAIRQKEFSPFLLHGVTGSGKTEVYLRAAEAALAEDRSVLVLVPEIALATQLEGHFYSRFGEKIALLHSGLTKGERFDQWTRIAAGEAKIVIGARSALFAPLQDPGLLIVDEEHDGAYKQEDGLRYQARDLAVLRASQQDAAVILGSATPSVISYHHARSGKYRLLRLTKRIENRPLPEIRIVDLRSTEKNSAKTFIFSDQLLAALAKNLDQGQQSLLFLNRRGYANLMLCRQCGQTVQCRHCNITLTLHRSKNELTCHYCGFTASEAALCANCRSADLVAVGFGTERIEEELRQLFPKANIARLDRDTIKKRRDYITILKTVHAGDIDILIGTQMIAKGHHFPNVTLVGIVWADAGLGLPDFRSGERTFQLLAQVTGRSGRGEIPGRVIIQTHQAEHYSIAAAKAHDYEGLFERELAARTSLSFPPFSRLINFRLAGQHEESVMAAAESLARIAQQRIKPHMKISVLGPAPAPISKIRGKYRWQLLLKGQHLESLHALCGILLANPPVECRSGTIKLSVDVDPENML